MANHSETNTMTHFLTSLIELIFIKLETWSFSVSFLTHVFCVMPPDMCLLSDFKESEVNQNQGLTNHKDSEKDRKRKRERLPKRYKQYKEWESGGMQW